MFSLSYPDGAFCFGPSAEKALTGLFFVHRRLIVIFLVAFVMMRVAEIARRPYDDVEVSRVASMLHRCVSLFMQGNCL